MYTGYTIQCVWTEECLTKTKGFVREAFENGQKFSWCPCLRCGNWEKRTEAEMGKHLQKSGFTPDYTCGHFMVSLPNVTELRWIVVAPTSMVPGWKTWCKAMMMLGIRTRRWRNLQRPSMKCWSLRNVRSTSTLSFVSWNTSHK